MTDLPILVASGGISDGRVGDTELLRCHCRSFNCQRARHSISFMLVLRRARIANNQHRCRNLGAIDRQYPYSEAIASVPRMARRFRMAVQERYDLLRRTRLRCQYETRYVKMAMFGCRYSAFRSTGGLSNGMGNFGSPLKTSLGGSLVGGGGGGADGCAGCGCGDAGLFSSDIKIFSLKMNVRFYPKAPND